MEKEQKPQNIHMVLARSYMMYFLFCAIGLWIDSYISVDFPFKFATYASYALFIIGPALILWAQLSSRKFEKGKDAKKHFYYGPYAFLRNPTHLGLLLLVAGYTFVSGSVIFFATTLVSYILSSFFYKQHEEILHDTYGKEYDNYKEDVKKIL